MNAWSKDSETTYVATPAQSWIDDYFAFSVTDNCCYYNRVTKYACQSDYTGEHN